MAVFGLSASSRVLAALRRAGIETEILQFPQETRTAQDAAAAVGTTVAQIVKSLVFLADGRPVLALVSGANQVDPRKLADAAGVSTVVKAAAGQVREATGFAIGGVPPLGHVRALPVFLDADLMRLDVVYAAAGTPNAVFAIAPAELRRITAAAVVELRQAT
jgi:Cys-tRNA(Pro) deacylase